MQMGAYVKYIEQVPTSKPMTLEQFVDKIYNKGERNTLKNIFENPEKRHISVVVGRVKTVSTLMHHRNRCFMKCYIEEVLQDNSLGSEFVLNAFNKFAEGLDQLKVSRGDLLAVRSALVCYSTEIAEDRELHDLQAQVDDATDLHRRCQVWLLRGDLVREGPNTYTMISDLQTGCFNVFGVMASEVKIHSCDDSCEVLLVDESCRADESLRVTLRENKLVCDVKGRAILRINKMVVKRLDGRLEASVRDSRSVVAFSIDHPGVFLPDLGVSVTDRDMGRVGELKRWTSRERSMQPPPRPRSQQIATLLPRRCATPRARATLNATCSWIQDIVTGGRYTLWVKVLAVCTAAGSPSWSLVVTDGTPPQWGPRLLPGSQVSSCPLGTEEQRRVHVLVSNGAAATFPGLRAGTYWKLRNVVVSPLQFSESQEPVPAPPVFLLDLDAGAICPVPADHPAPGAIESLLKMSRRQKSPDSMAMEGTEKDHGGGVVEVRRTPAEVLPASDECGVDVTDAATGRPPQPNLPAETLVTLEPLPAGSTANLDINEELPDPPPRPRKPRGSAANIVFPSVPVAATPDVVDGSRCDLAVRTAPQSPEKKVTQDCLVADILQPGSYNIRCKVLDIMRDFNSESYVLGVTDGTQPYQVFGQIGSVDSVDTVCQLPSRNDLRITLIARNLPPDTVSPDEYWYIRNVVMDHTKLENWDLPIQSYVVDWTTSGARRIAPDDPVITTIERLLRNGVGDVSVDWGSISSVHGASSSNDSTFSIKVAVAAGTCHSSSEITDFSRERDLELQETPSPTKPSTAGGLPSCAPCLRRMLEHKMRPNGEFELCLPCQRNPRKMMLMLPKWVPGKAGKPGRGGPKRPRT